MYTHMRTQLHPINHLVQLINSCNRKTNLVHAVLITKLGCAAEPLIFSDYAVRYTQFCVICCSIPYGRHHLAAAIVVGCIERLMTAGQVGGDGTNEQKELLGAITGYQMRTAEQFQAK